MKKLIIFVISIAKCYSQDTPFFSVNNLANNVSESKIELLKNGEYLLINSMRNTSTNEYSEVIFKGTPFYDNATFENETVYLAGGTMKMNLNFNLYRNVVYFSNTINGPQTAIYPDSFSINNHFLKKVYPQYKNAYFKDYYENILNEAKVKLFKKAITVGKYYETSKTTIIDNREYRISGTFENTFKYFFGVNNKLIEVDFKRNIFKLFGKHRNHIKEFANNNNLNPENESDLLKIATEYSKIIK